MDVSEPVRVWVAEALSGNVIDEVLLAGSSTWSSRFGGGTCSASVSLGHLVARDRRTLDWDAIARTVDLLTGGKHTLVLTVGTVVLGEWLLMSRDEGTGDRSIAGTLEIKGVELDGYTAFRSLNYDYWGSDADQLTLARMLLWDCFINDQLAMKIDIPTVASGVVRKIMHRARDAYYSDVLDEISEPDDGFDWRIVQTGTWVGGDLTRVNRAVQFGVPVLARSTSIVVDHDGPGFRSGNCTTFKQGQDFARSAARVDVLGSGQGDRAPLATIENQTLPSQGYLRTSRTLNKPSIKELSTLQGIARAESVQSQNLRDPATAVLLAAKTQAMPRVGDKVAVDIEPTYSLPYGREGDMRVGEVTFPLDGHQMSTVTIQAI